MDCEEYLIFAKEIALEAGKIMKKYFYSNNECSYKNDNTVVSKADKEINSYLIDKVKEKYPEHSVDGEEEQFGNSRFKWICDPIDGTAMYVRHIPVAVFSLAFAVDGIPELGVVYDVFTDNLYTAQKGKGAFCNGKSISVNEYKLSDIQSVAHFDMWKDSDYNLFDIIKDLGKKTYFVSIGSIIRASMCVASGDFTVAIFPGTIRKNCDIAAVKIIVEEAGGIVTDLFGNEQKYDDTINGAIISNKITFNEVKNTINLYLKNN